MKQKLSGRDYTYVASMLFGMFFGAGNPIFPVHMGQMAGANVWPAVIGFCVTAVGLPLLGVAALGISRSGGFFELGSRVGKALLDVFHLPALPDHRAVLRHPAAPPPPSPWDWSRCCRRAAIRGSACWRSPPPSSPRRCSSRSARARSSSGSARCSTPASCCSSAFWSSWRCSARGAAVGAVVPEGAYAAQPFFTGFLEGYNTMDALASLAFGIVVVQVIRDLGVTEPDAVAGSTVRAGIFSCLLMAAIYVAVTIVGVQSRGLFETLGKRRHRPRADRAALPRLRRPSDPRRDRDARLPQDLRGPHHQLRGDLHGPLPRGPTYRVWAVIFSLVSPALRQLRSELHHRLLRPCADVPIPSPSR